MAVTRTLVLDDLVIDPAYFSTDLLELAKKTKRENETVEDRLMELYREAVRKIQEEHQDERGSIRKRARLPRGNLRSHSLCRRHGG